MTSHPRRSLSDVPLLEERALSIKRRFLEMYMRANAGHVGCALSCADILAFVKFGWMEGEDDLILSKGHAAAALYSTLAEAGDLTPEDIATFYRDGTLLSAHPPPGKLPGIPFATGSLGQGVSLATGLALAAKLKGETSRRTFCVASDGELDEGSTWEAALFAAHHRLSNLVWLIDRNGIQGFGRTEDVLSLEPVADKFRSFNWSVHAADGHSMQSLLDARNAVLATGAHRPSVVICRTVKGRGMGGWADTVDCHYRPMTPEIFDALMVAVGGHGAPRASGEG
jgi:transketolase